MRPRRVAKHPMHPSNPAGLFPPLNVAAELRGQVTDLRAEVADLRAEVADLRAEVAEIAHARRIQAHDEELACEALSHSHAVGAPVMHLLELPWTPPRFHGDLPERRLAGGLVVGGLVAGDQGEAARRDPTVEKVEGEAAGEVEGEAGGDEGEAAGDGA